MKLSDVLNSERVNSLGIEPNAYATNHYKPPKSNNDKVQTANIPKVIFPEPYENADPYYNKHEFAPPQSPPQQNFQQPNMPSFDFKSIIPMLMSGKMDILKPIMSLFSGGKGLGDLSKIFELFKAKPKQKKEESKQPSQESKFDDMIIIED